MPTPDISSLYSLFDAGMWDDKGRYGLTEQQKSSARGEQLQAEGLGILKGVLSMKYGGVVAGLNEGIAQGTQAVKSSLDTFSKTNLQNATTRVDYINKLVNTEDAALKLKESAEDYEARKVAKEEFMAMALSNVDGMRLANEKRVYTNQSEKDRTDNLISLADWQARVGDVAGYERTMDKIATENPELAVVKGQVERELAAARTAGATEGQSAVLLEAFNAGIGNLSDKTMIFDTRLGSWRKLTGAELEDENLKREHNQLANKYMRLNIENAELQRDKLTAGGDIQFTSSFESSLTTRAKNTITAAAEFNEIQAELKAIHDKYLIGPKGQRRSEAEIQRQIALNGDDAERRQELQGQIDGVRSKLQNWLGQPIDPNRPFELPLDETGLYFMYRENAIQQYKERLAAEQGGSNTPAGQPVTPDGKSVATPPAETTPTAPTGQNAEPKPTIPVAHTEGVEEPWWDEKLYPDLFKPQFVERVRLAWGDELAKKYPAGPADPRWLRAGARKVAEREAERNGLDEKGLEERFFVWQKRVNDAFTVNLDAINPSGYTGIGDGSWVS